MRCSPWQQRLPPTYYTHRLSRPRHPRLANLPLRPTSPTASAASDVELDGPIFASNALPQPQPPQKASSSAQPSPSAEPSLEPEPQRRRLLTSEELQAFRRANWFQCMTCFACAGEPAAGIALVKCTGCDSLFCNVHCERRDSCPHESCLTGNNDADDEAGAGLGCQCACCQNRLPPPCFDCNSSPCYCPSVVGPGERWMDNYTQPGRPRPRYFQIAVISLSV